MKKTLLFLMLFTSLVSFEVMGQCGRVGLIGEFNGWAADYWMTRNPETPELFTVILTVKASDDPNSDGIIELKFRANSDWTTNWGSADFPSGTAVVDGPNIPVPYGSYLVSFNCASGAYNFVSTCANVGLIGEFNGWAADEWMTRDMASPDNYTSVLVLTAASDGNGDGLVEMKFRAGSDWATNWGAVDFPSGVGVVDGPNIPVPVGSYVVTFNCATGAYSFLSTCGNLALIGEFNGWAADEWMTRSTASPDNWSVLLTLTDAMDGNADGIIEMKFRMNSDWGFNWGAVDFPSGIGAANGPNIPVPLDATGLTTDYLVTFNCATGAYTFTAASGAVSMIGQFNNWNGDVPMNRDAVNPNLWKLSRSWFADSPVKFRENKDWTVNWGNNTFPSGTGTDNGPNIPLVAGKYDVTFNSTTFEYNFVANSNFCGEIGMIGDFNEWGGDPSAPTDIWMVRDPIYPSDFKITYNFTSSTQFLFRLDADATFTNVWGGTFPEGTGVMDPSKLISVPGGKYDITFNCKSGDFKFTRLGNAVIAPKVFAINIDGNLNEADWNIDQVISNVVYGTPVGTPNNMYFGVTYNAEFLYVGLDVQDTSLTPYEMGEVFIDGNKSGGVYDTNDLYIRFAGPYIQVMYPDTIMGIQLGFQVKPQGDGYTAELAIPWSEIHVTAEEGQQIGFDIMIADRDSLTPGIEYIAAWNGGLQDYTNTSSFGDLLFGGLSCGCISLYNDVVGDVVLQNPTDQPTYYVGSYEVFDAQNLVFRKDLNSAVRWGAGDFPDGTALLGNPPTAVPATTGRYRVDFDCITGAYHFVSAADTGQVAYSEYIDTPPAIDGELSEYTLSYGSDKVVEGTYNNTVTWGSRWDETSLYFGVHVVDGTVYGGSTSGNWTNDAIEYYIDGNHDRDGTYDAAFDTQLVQDAFANTPPVDTALWVKADGVPVPNFTAKWLITGDGYSVELRLGWDNFSFLPGKGRTIGFSLGCDDNDSGGGARDGQSVWFGTAANWSNTADLGDLQLNGGPYYFNIGDVVDYSDQIVLFPNPSAGNVYLRLLSDTFKGNVTVYVADIAGRTVVNEKFDLGSDNLIQLDANLFSPGLYFVNIIGQDGARATKKLIVR